jgi:hypothetical protein
MSEQSIQKKSYLHFSFGNKVETSVNNKQGIRFPILKKGGYDDGLEID